MANVKPQFQEAFQIGPDLLEFRWREGPLLEKGNYAYGYSNLDYGWLFNGRLNQYIRVVRIGGGP